MTSIQCRLRLEARRTRNNCTIWPNLAFVSQWHAVPIAGGASKAFDIRYAENCPKTFGKWTCTFMLNVLIAPSLYRCMLFPYLTWSKKPMVVMELMKFQNCFYELLIPQIFITTKCIQYAFRDELQFIFHTDYNSDHLCSLVALTTKHSFLLVRSFHTWCDLKTYSRQYVGEWSVLSHDLSLMKYILGQLPMKYIYGWLF